MSGTSRRSLHRQVSQSVSTAAATKDAVPEQVKASPTPVSNSGPASVAIDLGSYSIRICITRANGKKPIVTCCPNALVRPSQKRYSGASTSLLAGPLISQKCTNYGSLSVRQPMDRGFIVDWPTQKMILDAALLDALSKEEQGLKSDRRLLEGREVIITEAYLNLPDLQAGLDLLLLEAYGASKIWRCNPALLIPYQPNLFATNAGPKKRTRPECLCIIDLGHNATHVIPVVGDAVIWSSVKRHIISQRMLTNLLKETLSFRQWDMMDEPWLVGHIKERCCFVANNAGRRGDEINVKRDPPSSWSYAGMIEMCRRSTRHQNPLLLEYVLPDYALSSVEKLGYVRGNKEGTRTQDLDTFITGMRVGDRPAAPSNSRDKEEGSADEEEDESDDDFQEGSPGAPPTKQQPQKKRKAAEIDQEDETEQVLVLERERFQIPEIMFDPGTIGLDDAPLHRVIEASIKACNEEVQGLLWANIVLVGGGAKMPGLKDRIYNELRPLAPQDIPLQIWMSKDPAMSALEGAQSLLLDSPRLLRSRLLPASEYTLQASRETFGSWSGSSSALPLL